MRRTIGAALLPFFLALMPAVALAQSTEVCSRAPGSGGILTGLANQFATTTAPWTNTALGYAQGLFFGLVGIEIAWSAITYVLQKDSLPDFVAALLLKIMSVGFFFTLLQPQYGPVWINDIIASFSQAGSAIGGQPAFGPSDPSSVFTCGTDIGNAILQSISQNQSNPWSLGNIGPAIIGCIAAFVGAIGVVFAFAIVAGQLLITLIESYIVVGAGVFMLGFTGSRWTLIFGERYFGYAVSVGIKLFMLELIVGLGYGLGTQWAALFANGIAPPETYIEVAAASLIFSFLAWQIPSLAGSLMNGSPRMTLGSFLSTAGATVVGGAVALGGARTLVGAAIPTEALRVESASTSSRPLALTDGASFSHDTSGRSWSADPFTRERDSWSTSESVPPSATYETSDSGDGSSPSTPHAESNDATSEQRSDADPGNAASGNAFDDTDVTDSDVAGEDTAQTHASDQAVAREDARNTRETERRDAQPPPSPQPGAFNPGALRSPPFPNDAADDSIHIRFHHPE